MRITRSFSPALRSVLIVGGLLWASTTAAAASETRRIRISDDCDPATFNAAVGPGTCVGHGETTFNEFLAEIKEDRSAEEWAFQPRRLAAKQSDTIVAFNGGGELHTMTEVHQFGGGVVPLLNGLSGNPVPAPECSDPGSKPDPVTGFLPFAATAVASFVPPGATLPADVPPIGHTELYQCCIHPWMHIAITGKKG
jgi:hypothetical protein